MLQIWTYYSCHIFSHRLLYSREMGIFTQGSYLHRLYSRFYIYDSPHTKEQPQANLHFVFQENFTTRSAQLTYSGLERCEHRQVNWDEQWNVIHLPDQKKLTSVVCEWLGKNRYRTGNVSGNILDHFQITSFSFSDDWYLLQHAISISALGHLDPSLQDPYWCHKHHSQLYRVSPGGLSASVGVCSGHLLFLYWRVGCIWQMTRRNSALTLCTD